MLTILLLFAAPPDFAAEVRPLLSDRCFKCHGPDAGHRQAKLRLDTREGLLGATAEGVAILVPGKPADSALVQRTAAHGDERMPPASSKLSLSPAEIDALRAWVAAGAAMPAKAHWAFNPVVAPPVPEGPGAALPIDRLVRAKLSARGLKPAADAPRPALLRRASLGLVGLPPTLAEQDEFLADARPDAFARRVDRLLASPHYGEHMAREWLDLARYADTYGYQADVERDMSPWRDWVVAAFNRNLPFDRFGTEQIAGDLLPNAAPDQILATAFNRLHRQTNEGGSIDEEFRVEYVADRVHTFGTAFLGLTFECCRCHDHKFDPLPQRDYYRLSAFFNNIDESGLYSHFTRATPTPTLTLHDPAAAAKHAAAKEQVRRAESALAEALDAARGRAALAKFAPVPAAPTARLLCDAAANGLTPNAVDPKKPAQLGAATLAAGRAGKALLLNGDDAVVWPGVGDFGRTDPFSFALWLKPAKTAERAVVLHKSRAWSDSGSRGYELLLEHGRPSFSLVHFYPGNALHVRAKSALPPGEWSHVAVSYDGSSRAAGLRLFVNGAAGPTETVRDGLTRDIRHRAEWGDAEAGGIHLQIGARFRDNGFKGGTIDDVQVFDTALTAWEAAQLAGLPAPNDPAARHEHYGQRHDSAVTVARSAARAARVEENALIGAAREIMAMREMPTPRPTYVLKRGSYEMPGERVYPGVPDAVAPWPADLPANRLGLARWLFDRKNPLAARVVVNRIWRQHFGRGLVATADDFGVQGSPPTHPELLDWLSARFMDGGWDVKALHRLILTSATWRQSSDLPPEGDPDNRWLSRGPRQRLTAEQTRDSALRVAGLLSPRLGGRAVKPYQPAGVWEEAGTGQHYVQDHGEALYRRSLYTFWRRTAPPPTMLAFDAPTREVCVAKRPSAATPAQALLLLNDVQFVEAARALAENLLRAPGDDAARRAGAFRSVVGRTPSAAESRILARLHDEQRATFRKNSPAADAFLKVGERPRDAKLDAVETAALAATVNLLFAHDEFATVR